MCLQGRRGYYLSNRHRQFKYGTLNLNQNHSGLSGQVLTSLSSSRISPIRNYGVRQFANNRAARELAHNLSVFFTLFLSSQVGPFPQTHRRRRLETVVMAHREVSMWSYVSNKFLTQENEYA